MRRLATDAERATLVARLLAGLFVAILAAELLLLAIGPGGAGPAGQGLVEDLRVLLAVAAALTVPLAIVLGVLVRPAYALFGLLAVPVVVAYAVTGLLMPWTQLSFWIGQLAIEATLSVPIAGETLAQLFFGGFSLGEATRRSAFAFHYAIVALSTLLIALGIGPRVVRRRAARDSRTA